MCIRFKRLGSDDLDVFIMFGSCKDSLYFSTGSP
jgi:hypothetical protein